MVLITIIENLKSIDNAILLWINSRHTGFLDIVMWNASEKFTWIPLYAIVGYLMIRKYGKASWLPIICVVLAIVMSDQGSNHLVKAVVMRYRPSHNFTLQSQLRYVNGYVGGLYGFASSHAANTAAFTVFVLLLIYKKYLAVLLFFYVALVCYSRVYLGVHYPSDIAGGIVIGAVCGVIAYGVYKLMNDRFMNRPKTAG